MLDYVSGIQFAYAAERYGVALFGTLNTRALKLAKWGLLIETLLLELPEYVSKQPGANRVSLPRPDQPVAQGDSI